MGDFPHLPPLQGGGIFEMSRVTQWAPSCDSAEAERAGEALESGQIVFLPSLRFDLDEAERRLLDPAVSDGRTKNISFDPTSGVARGTSLSGAERERLERLMARYHAATRSLLESLFPAYAAHLTSGRTSFRPVRIDDRPTSWRKDDRRLHVDAFPSQPLQGRRILRVFSNVNPEGEPRVWTMGEPFAAVARLAPRRARLLPGAAWAMERLGVTKGRRTAYDDLMLRLHDGMKRDERYQTQARSGTFAFPAATSWIVYTDLVSHAAISGQHTLEQTFYLPVIAMREPERSPLRILERTTGRDLVGRFGVN
jgi:hypothetical protein